jgi:flagellar hook-basal body complex protein FliE
MTLPPISSLPLVAPQALRPDTPGAKGPGFADRIGAAVNELAAAQDKAASSAQAFEMGTQTDLASVMVDQQISSLGFQFALNVRNKALGAYRDIMNMPV